ncbi:MAG: ion transporter [Candidatus Saccharimonas sp.]
MHSPAGKQKLRRFLATKELIMMTLVVLNIAFLAYEHFFEPPEAQLLAIELFDILTGLLFISEFAFEWYFARSRSQYFRQHWFYLFAAVPIPTTSFEILRGIRALRLLKLLKIFAHLRYERNTRLFEESPSSKV